MPRTKKKPSRTSSRRASWQGMLSFGLVSFPVEAFNALDRDHSDIHFNQLHEKCHNRIRYQKVCPVHGKVPNEEIISGYEVKKGEYVEVEPEELQSLRSESDRALKIDSFVTADTVDPLYFDGRMYYLVPDGAAAQEPYAVIVEAMKREERCAIGTVVFSGKDQLVLLRPLHGIIHMAMLNYEAEIRPPRTEAAAIKKPASIARQVKLAQTLIEEWSDDKFNFAKYEDHNREKIQELIRLKKRGKTVAPSVDEDDAPPVLNLMDALKRSVSARKKSGPSKARSSRRSA